MKKILLLNNTESFHSGSLQVINFLKKHLSHYHIDLNQKIKILDPQSYDLIILNGEGTLHDDSKKVKSYMSFLSNASDLGVKTFLVNAVWQNNSKEYCEILKKIDYIGVREIKSKKEILKHITIDNIDIDLDLSYYIDVEKILFPKTNIISGNYYVSGKESTKLIKNVGEDGYIDIFNDSWNNIVNKLRMSNLLITGRHHEMYAACKARCPFIVIDGNTHKNTGLLETFGVNIPTLQQNCSLEEINQSINSIPQYKDQFLKLFDRMEQHPFPKFINYV